MTSLRQHAYGAGMRPNLPRVNVSVACLLSGKHGVRGQECRSTILAVSRMRNQRPLVTL